MTTKDPNGKDVIVSTAYSPNEIREGLREVLANLDHLLSCELCEDGTYEVSAIEIQIDELLGWRKAINEAVRP